MTLQGLLSIIAIILAPIIAVRIETWLALKREKRERRLMIFRNLMATREILSKVVDEGWN
jgi:hypothetical protein